MNRWLAACLCIMSLAFAGAALSVARDVHVIREQAVASAARGETQASGVTSRLDGLIAAWSSIAAKVDASAAINLKIAQDTNARTRATAGETEKLVASSRRSAEHIETITIPKVDAAVDEFSSQTKNLVQSAQKPLNSLTIAVDEFSSGEKETFQRTNAALDQVKVVLNTSDATLVDFRARVNQFQPILEDTHVMTTNGAKMFTEGEKYFHALLNPAKRPFWDVTVIKIGEALSPAVIRAALSRFFREKVTVVP